MEKELNTAAPRIGNFAALLAADKWRPAMVETKMHHHHTPVDHASHLDRDPTEPKAELHHRSQPKAHDYHAHHIEVLRKRFWVSLALTVPILALSHMFWQLFDLTGVEFPGSLYLLFGLSSMVFFYGGWPFLSGLVDELRAKNPGMMTLIAVAITVAYAYSSAVVFGLTGMVFFWELATLIDIMLLGHWIEMKSVMGASRALEELARLMPSDAHKLIPDGNIQDVPVSELAKGDRVLVKP